MQYPVPELHLTPKVLLSHQHHLPEGLGIPRSITAFGVL
jgi:hypothetical protein